MSETPDARVFTVTAEGGAGLTRGQVRGASFKSPSRGVRVSQDSMASEFVAERAGLLGCRPDAVLSDVAAARLWNLPLPPWIAFRPGAVSVAVAAGTAEPRRPDVKGRRVALPSFHVTEVHGVRVTTPARTWLDCAALVPFEHLVAMGDAILHRKLAAPGELSHLGQWGFRRRGVVNLRRALPLLDAGAESPGESLARVMLVSGGLPAPACNINIVVRGRWVARVDMAWVDEMVIVEYDGAVHLEEKQRRRDAERLNLLQAAGWRVIVLTADDLRRPEATCLLVRRALELRHPR